MIKQLIDYAIILLLSIAVISHFLRIVYLYFQPKIFDIYDFISKPDLGRDKIFLYYFLTILVCLYAINRKVHLF